MDTVTIKPGYIFNAGFTKIWGNNKDDDNLLGLQVSTFTLTNNCYHKVLE